MIYYYFQKIISFATRKTFFDLRKIFVLKNLVKKNYPLYGNLKQDLFLKTRIIFFTVWQRKKSTDASKHTFDRV